MSRLLPILIFTALAIAFGFALAGHPGRASLYWLGWRVDTSAVAVVAIWVGSSVLLAAIWRLAGWLATAPSREVRKKETARRRDALETLTRGFLALQVGDLDAADREARKATTLIDAAPVLSQLLAAEVAEARGDDAAAQAAYAMLLNAPEGRVAGQRGLRRLALRRGEAFPPAPLEPPPATPSPPPVEGDA